MIVSFFFPFLEMTARLAVKTAFAGTGLLTSAVIANQHEENANSTQPYEQGRQTVAAQKLKEAIRKSQVLLSLKKNESAVPGITVAVSVDGKSVWTHGFGYSDVENALVAYPNTVMRIASISKSMTMAAVARLWQDGKLDIDRTVGSYLSDDVWPKDKADITVRQLMAHTSGIRHYEKKGEVGRDNNGSDSTMKEFQMSKPFKSVNEALDIFKNDELLSQPGTEFHYTTHGFTVLSAVVEAVTGEPFEKHMKKTFAELGLNETYLDENEPIIPRRARYYRRDKGHNLINAPAVDNSCKWAGGGFLSTVHDVRKFGNAMLYSFQNTETAKNIAYHPGPYSAINRDVKMTLPGYLTSETVKSLWTPRVPMRGKIGDPDTKQSLHYGFGWTVLPRAKDFAFCRDQAAIFSHTGGAVGASSVLLIKPRDKPDTTNLPQGVVVAIICNMEGISLTKEAKQIAKYFETIQPADEAHRVQKVFQC